MNPTKEEYDALEASISQEKAVRRAAARRALVGRTIISIDYEPGLTLRLTLDNGSTVFVGADGYDGELILEARL